MFHAAGVNAMCVRDPAPMLHTNVEGSIAVVRATVGRQVSRASSTHRRPRRSERPPGIVGTEQTPHRGSFLSLYERSKFLAEQEVIAHAATTGVELVSVNPSSVQGPGRTDGSSRLLLDLVNGTMPVVIDTTVSIVDVHDCTDAHLLAEARGEPGSRYLVSGASITMRDAVALLRRISGRPRRVVFAPRAVAGAGRSITALTSKLGSRDPSICPEMVATLLHGHRYDGSLADRALDVRYTPLAETVRRTLAWYAERGMAPPPLEPAEGADPEHAGPADT